MKFPLLPESASTVSHRVDALYFALIGVCGFMLLLILAVMIFFLFRYRRGQRRFREQRSYSTLPFELTWTIIPLLVFLGFFVWGADIYQDVQRVPPDALDIHVVGKQWMWKVQHPTGNREIDELHVPVGRDVKLTLASQDVIHSFFIPAFRIKQDVVPGRYTTEWFKATRVGDYHLFCAEYCGKDHSRMIGWVHVMTPEDYEAWLIRGKPAEPTVESGARLFREFGCSGCHVGNGTVRAPPLEGLYGRPTPLMSREVVIADEKYIHDSILYPARDIAAGYEPLMPSYEGRITEEQIFELVTYIKSLGAARPATIFPGRP
jgi:cytochrome c oxidase subunit 2